MIGEHIGPYNVIDHLGSGAYGRTYLVMQGGTVLAMKLFKNEAVCPGILEKGGDAFRHRVMKLRKVESEIAVRYTDCGERDDESSGFYLVMEYVNGRSLEKAAAARDPLRADAGRLKTFAIQVLRGLADMHAAGVMHGDLRTKNVFITEDGTARLVDFGLSTLVDTSSLPVRARWLGMPWYTPPEVINGKPPHGESDLYSFGVLLYRLVTGNYPFTGENVYSLARAIADDRPRPPSSLNGAVTTAFESILLDLLEKDRRNRRFHTCHELAAAIEAAELFKI